METITDLMTLYVKKPNLGAFNFAGDNFRFAIVVKIASRHDNAIFTFFTFFIFKGIKGG